MKRNPDHIIQPLFEDSRAHEGEDIGTLVFTGRKLRIVQVSERRLLVRSAGRWSYAILLSICCVLAALGLWISALWVYMALMHPVPEADQNIAGLACGVPFTIFWTLMFFGTIHWLLQMALPRNIIIDLDAGTVEVRQIAGLSKRIRLSDVSSVDLAMFSGHGVCYLGFTDKSTGRLLPFHWLFGQFDSAIENRNSLAPAARLISQFVNKPCESSWGGWSWTIRKGTQSDVVQ